MLRCVWVAPGLGTAVHSDTPFNRLKAALNYESHVVDERGNASVALTSAGLSYFIKTPDKLASFIQEAFTLKDGSRISLAQALAFAGSVCAHLLPSGTCAVALPAVPRCTTPMLLCILGISTLCVWVCDAACKPLVFSMLTGVHKFRCVMALGQLWALRRARCPRVSVRRPRSCNPPR